MLFRSGDYDGDGVADIALFRAGDPGELWMKPSSGICPAEFHEVPSGEGPKACLRPIAGADAVIRADYDGDHLPDLLEWHAAERMWQMTPSSGLCTASLPIAGQSAEGRPVCKRQFGWPGDVPVR